MLRNLLIAAAMVFLGASVNAQMTQFCLPGQGGVLQCPCGNPPAGGGLGCNNFGFGPSKSGTLDATGVASLMSDSILLRATGLNSKVRCYFYTGSMTVPSGTIMGAGIRCVSGSLKILYPQPPPTPTGTGLQPPADKCESTIGGAISRPTPFTYHLSVSARSAQLGVPIVAGQTRYYFVLYQDPLAAIPCGNTISIVNTTNAGSIVWAQ